MMVLNSFPRPIIIAHRGASGHAPENTLAAFQLAVQFNAHAIELDAKLSADGEVVVIHDQTVDRTTNGKGAVRALPLKTLRSLDAGAFFDPNYAGERIPTLSEVFESVGGKILINVELTNYLTPFDDLPIKVAELVKQHHLEGSVLFSSFSPRSLRRVHRIFPEIPCALLAISGFLGAIARSRTGMHPQYQALHPNAKDVNGHLIERFHSAGVRVHAYTVNDPLEMRRLYALDIDGIITDFPLLAQQILSESLPIQQ